MITVSRRKSIAQPKTGSQRTNKVDNTISHAQSTGSFNTAADVLDLGAEFALLSIALTLELGEECFGESSKTGDDVPADQLLGLSDVAFLWNLHLQLAGSEAEVHDLLHARDFAAGQQRIVFGNLIAAGDTEINAALTDEGGDVCSGEEDEGDGEVLNQGNIQAGFAAELDITAGQKVQSGLLKTALCNGKEGISPGLVWGALVG